MDRDVHGVEVNGVMLGAMWCKWWGSAVIRCEDPHALKRASGLGMKTKSVSLDCAV